MRFTKLTQQMGQRMLK